MEEGAAPTDAELVAGLRAGDEAAFEWLVSRYRTPLLRLARQFVPTAAAAEDVVQDTFVAVFSGIDRFEGRSSFKTWLYRILMNIARTRGVRERRSLPFADLGGAGADDDRDVDADRFLSPSEDRDRHFRTSPRAWRGLPEDRALAGELRDVLEAALARLPEQQRTVVVLRDVVGLTGAEVCHELGLSETNQRVLLHRGRTKLRAALDEYLADPAGPTDPTPTEHP